MKKIVIFLILLVACQAFAQKSKVALFDFTHPQQLTPSITPAETGGDVVVVTDTQFKNGKINISFLSGTQRTGVQILTDKLTYPGETVYYLRVTATASIIFSSVGGAAIDSIRFSGNYTDPGDLYLDNDAPGYFDPFSGYTFWTANNEKNITLVSFTNSYRIPRLEQISVYYTEPSDVLTPLSTDISSTQTVPSFNEFNMTFADNMTILDADGITFSNSNGSVSKKMRASVSGKTVTLSLDSPITAEGTYKISVPARSFASSSGYENAALAYTINVETPKNTLNYLSVTPEQGETDVLSNGIVLTYPSIVKVAKECKPILMKDGEEYAFSKIEREEDDTYKNILITFDDVPKEIKDKGIYTLTIPEGTISDNMGKIYNPEFTLTYKVGYTPEPVETETMKAAKALLQKKGVGYPAENSESRKALAALTANTDASDDDLSAAMDAFYAETNVEMPVTGKFYNIASVNADGQKLYVVSIADGGVTFSTNVSQATAFEANIGDNAVFSTINGKYFYVKGVTTDEDVNALTLAKLGTDKIKEDVDMKQLLGMMSVYGTYKNAEGDILSPCAAWVSHDSKAFITDASTSYLHFTSAWSSAFVFTETVKPSDEQAVDAVYTITPDVVESSNDVLTVTFTELDNVTLSDTELPYFANSSGEEIEGADIYTVSGKGNQFMIRLGNFSDGDYKIVLPEGTFTYVSNGVTMRIKAISKDFKIGNGTSGGGDTGSGDDGGFSYTYNSLYCYKFKDIHVPVKDVELNEFIIYIIPGDYTDLVADQNKVVKIVRYNNIYDVKREGHFEKYEIPEKPGYPALKLILDEPIKSGDLKADCYGVHIEPGTIGDANFGKYLQNKNSVKPSECKVNSKITYPIDVDNSYVSGIDEVSCSDEPVNVIYDLMGRRVDSMSKPGIYIINGRKVVKK